MGLPKRCLKAAGVDIDAAHEGRCWPDGTPKSPGNAFNWSTRAPSVFNTKKNAAQERWRQAKLEGHLEQNGAHLVHKRNWASMIFQPD